MRCLFRRPVMAAIGAMIYIEGTLDGIVSVVMEKMILARSRFGAADALSVR